MTSDQIAITFFLVLICVFVCGFIVAMDGWAALGHILLWLVILFLVAGAATAIIAVLSGGMVL